jgi:Phytanoyl-CoA dioxygenase (PhyH)
MEAALMARTLDADGKTSYEQRCVEVIESVTGNMLGDVRGDFDTHGFAILRSALQPGHVATLYATCARELQRMRTADTLTAIVNDEPYEEDEKNLEHAMTTSLRSQCLLVDDDDLAQARADISHRIACLPNTSPSPQLWSQFRALESQPLTAQQVFHKDSTSTQNLSVIVALQDDGAVFSVVPGSHLPDAAEADNCSRRAIQVRLAIGDMLVFRTNLSHAGGAYVSRNIRIHCYVFVEAVAGSGESDRRPNAEEDRVNGEPENEVRCSMKLVVGSDRPGPVLAELPLRTQRSDLVSLSGPGETPLQQFTELLLGMTIAWVPTHLVRLGVDGRTPAAVHARDVRRSISEGGFLPGKEILVCFFRGPGGCMFLTFDGYHRALALVSLGWQTIPVKIVRLFLPPRDRLRLSRAVHAIDDCRRAPTLLDTVRSLYEVMSSAHGRIRRRQHHLVIDVGFKNYSSAKRELAMAHRLYRLSIHCDERLCHRFFNLGSELSSQQINACMNVASMHGIFHHCFGTDVDAAQTIDVLESILEKVASGAKVPTVIRYQHVQDATARLLDEAGPAKKRRRRMDDNFETERVADDADGDDDEVDENNPQAADVDDNTVSEEADENKPADVDDNTVSEASDENVADDDDEEDKNKTPDVDDNTVSEDADENPAVRGARSGGAAVGRLGKRSTGPPVRCHPAKRRQEDEGDDCMVADGAEGEDGECDSDRLSDAPAGIDLTIGAAPRQNVTSIPVKPVRAAEACAPVSIGTSLRWTLDRCHGTECVARMALRMRSDGSFVPISGTFYIGESPPAGDMPRATTLENLSKVFGKASMFVVKECCFCASNENGVIIEPQYAELLRNASATSEFLSLIAGISVKIE